MWPEPNRAHEQMEKHFQTAALRDATLQHHQAIFEAIEARKPRAARGAVRAHLAHVDREFSRGWDQLKRER